ncbi:hypothetical protein M433DRAFT_459884 [Acidomyces richmondensis BFW]|nr:MAG: hypothetical protein FE78DRAFT_256532 [Acidomyces sp. 'richmondensis']KYG47952.1 hypothetical protein M433DRAFT_459884 [Acidomyces richmondensis BFW]
MRNRKGLPDHPPDPSTICTFCCSMNTILPGARPARTVLSRAWSAREPHLRCSSVSVMMIHRQSHVVHTLKPPPPTPQLNPLIEPALCTLGDVR